MPDKSEKKCPFELGWSGRTIRRVKFLTGSYKTSRLYFSSWRKGSTFQIEDDVNEGQISGHLEPMAPESGACSWKWQGWDVKSMGVTWGEERFPRSETEDPRGTVPWCLASSDRHREGRPTAVSEACSAPSWGCAPCPSATQKAGTLPPTSLTPCGAFAVLYPERGFSIKSKMETSRSPEHSLSWKYNFPLSLCGW